VPRRYVPRRGDIVWLSFAPQAGDKQAGRRPALILSPSAYNGKVGPALCCPITSRVKGYPFEATVPKGPAVAGVVLADPVKSLDWRARHAEFVDRLPDADVSGVMGLVMALLSEGDA
jgi:mRNA interferase MazF